MGKKFQELDLSNAYLFAAVMQDEETCRLVLQTIIGREIRNIRVHAEHTMFYNSDYKSVRLDIYAKDTLEVSYDIEMQNTDQKNLAKRSRFYQSEMDAASLKPGEDYESLKPSYIIFICTFDPFGKGKYRYSFRPYCKEADIYLEDETERIFLSTKGKNEAEVPPGLVHFLHYIENSTGETAESSGDKAVDHLHDRVQRLKRNREMEVGYMYLQELLDDEKKIARKEGLQEGLQEGRREGRKEGLREGRREGRKEVLIEILEENGELPEELKQKIWQQSDPQALGRWIRLAARVKSMEEFITQM